MMCLVDAACHPERGVDEAVADLLVTITTKGITITGLKSLCGLLNEAVQRKATANAAHKLVLFWIDKTRRKRWVVNVQVQVLNLLFTMLVNRSSESEAATAKVLDYFKYQFVNIRDHKTPSTPAINVDWRDELRTARQCILTHATVCLAEIKRSAISLRGVAEVVPLFHLVEIQQLQKMRPAIRLLQCWADLSRCSSRASLLRGKSYTCGLFRCKAA